VGEVQVGIHTYLAISKGECARISTGAMIPEGADSVVMTEYAEEEEGQVKIQRSISPGENIIRIGNEFRKGDVIFRRGRRLSLFDTGALSSIGLSGIDVYKKPRVSIMSTGNELLATGQQIDLGKIYDINSVTIHHAVTWSGGSPIDLGILPDDLNRIAEAIRSALELSDIVLVSGGTSKGPGDLMLEVIQKLARPDFLIHGIAMKPGKPTILTSMKGKLLITLPGYPTSALIVYYTLADPAIRKIAHQIPYNFRIVKARTCVRFYSEIGRREFKPCRITSTGEGILLATPVLTGSEAIASLVDADGFMIIGEDTEFVKEGEEVEIYIFPHRLEEISHLTGERL
jgi:putative molybdopterin biosynthesis protein